MRGHRTARVGSLIEHAPITTRPEVHLGGGSLFMLTVIRPAWAYRIELAGIALLAYVYVWLSEQVGSRQRASILILVATAVLMGVPPVRNGLATLLHRSHLRRRWTLACRHAELATVNDRVPRITRASFVPSGDLLWVRMPAGRPVEDLEHAAETAAAFLEVREVRVARDRENARYARVVVVRRDPLAELAAMPWPHLAAPELSLWAPVPVGLDEDGQLVTVSLIERNVLIGGEPGGGKSVGQSMLTATAALDPACELTLLDGKYVELASWVGCAARTVGPNQDECIDVLRALVKEMDDRYLLLVANRQRKVRREDGWKLHVIVCDELAFYLNTGSRNGDKEAGNLMRDLVSRGRAAGVIFLAATQKPSGDTIPTYLRDLFAFRWAFRCTTPQMSDTILGAGWSTAGFTASLIDAAHRGVGYLLHEGGEPVRMRTFYLTDEDLSQLAGRAERVRRPPAKPVQLPGVVEHDQVEGEGAA
jgi:DNA translocase FtsK/SpoIIIE-like protein